MCGLRYCFNFQRLKCVFLYRQIYLVMPAEFVRAGVEFFAYRSGDTT
jgi:hypothetical protein